MHGLAFRYQMLNLIFNIVILVFRIKFVYSFVNSYYLT